MNSIGTKNLGEYKRDLLFYFISICNKQIALDIMDHDLYKSIPLKELNEIDNVNSIGSNSPSFLGTWREETKNRK